MSEAVVENPPFMCSHSAVVDPRTLKPHPSNPNKHPPKQVEFFIEILRYQGWRRPITISLRSGFVTKGHGALQAALAAGFTEVPIDQQNYDSNDAEVADLVADNQLQRMSEMDTGKLTELVVHLHSAGDDRILKMTALEDKSIKKLLGAFDRKHPDKQGLEEPAAGGVLPGSVIVGPGAVEELAAGEADAPSRLIQLFLAEADAAEFLRICDFFQVELDLGSVAEAVMTVMRSAYASHTEEGVET